MGIGEEKRYFDREFKYEAIRLIDEGKRSVRDNAKDLDIHSNVLHQRRRKYRTRREARGSVFEYIEVFYNRVRRHSALNYCSPSAFERGARVA
jgi:transposase-like protein